MHDFADVYDEILHSLFKLFVIEHAIIYTRRLGQAKRARRPFA
jgi:hypothetical protein